MKATTRIDALSKDLTGERIVVVGMATTGMAAAEFLAQQGATVTVSEIKTEGELGTAPELLRSLGVKVELGKHVLETFLSGDLIVLSPGVNPTIFPLEKARDKGIPIVSEVELASWFLSPPLIAVTGTNGKSTTTAFIGHILSSWGKRAFVGGNIGIPLTTYLLHGEEADYIVAEISSFQLEGISSFRPWISLLLNLGEDHLDRHPTLASYAAVKARIFLNQRPKDWAVVNTDDATAKALCSQIRAQILPFGRDKSEERGVWLEDKDTIVYRKKGGEEKFSLERVQLKGMHNRENIMAAVGAAAVCGVPTGVIQEALISFQGLEHRLEQVGVWRGVSFYNDSKATNVASAITALQSLEGPIILLAGGRDKGGDYAPMREILKKRVKALILMGEAKEKMRKAFQDLVPVHLVDDMEEGVRVAWRLAQDGDAILLSPACSSFDMYQDYRERGRIFKESVLRLAEGTS
jgi:UDP-N-acetylmuramoylalanine--D-glutamate ligase